MNSTTRMMMMMMTRRVGVLACLLLLLVLVAGCGRSDPPALESASRAPAPAPSAAAPLPPPIPMSVGQFVWWTMDQQTIAEAMSWEYWLYISANGDTEDELLSPVTCRPSSIPKATECRAALPASPAWQPGIEHTVTFTAYNPRNGMESPRSTPLVLFLTASVGPTPQNPQLEVPTLQPKPPPVKLTTP